MLSAPDRLGRDGKLTQSHYPKRMLDVISALGDAKKMLAEVLSALKS